MHNGISLRSAALLFVALGVGCGGRIDDPDDFDSQRSNLLLLTPTVDPDRELLITDVSVVEDPVRTVYKPGVQSGPQGAWSFGRLVENMSGKRSASDFMLNLLSTWESDQKVNADVAPARPAIRTVITEPWLAASGCAITDKNCTLDFTKAPFRLTAIVNRLDKRDLPDFWGRVTDAGEGRFVFNALSATGTPLNFTVILEYQLPAKNAFETFNWAFSWHSLGSLPFGSNYNATLQGITDRFSGRGVQPSRPNASALNAFRTNEVSLAVAGTDPTNPPSTKLWEIRSFAIGNNGYLFENTVAQTPMLSLNGTSDLSDWLNDNAASVLAGSYEFPKKWLGAASPIPFGLAWTAPGVRNPLVVSAFAINTCSGCHRSETGATFVHIGKRNAGEPVALSSWLTQVDLGRRVKDLEKLLSVNLLPQAGDTIEIRLGRGH